MIEFPYPHHSFGTCQCWFVMGDGSMELCSASETDKSLGFRSSILENS